MGRARAASPTVRAPRQPSATISARGGRPRFALRPIATLPVAHVGRCGGIGSEGCLNIARGGARGLGCRRQFGVERRVGHQHVGAECYVAPQLRCRTLARRLRRRWQPLAVLMIDLALQPRATFGSQMRCRLQLGHTTPCIEQLKGPPSSEYIYQSPRSTNTSVVYPGRQDWWTPLGRIGGIVQVCFRTESMHTQGAIDNGTQFAPKA